MLILILAKSMERSALGEDIWKDVLVEAIGMKAQRLKRGKGVA